MKLFFTLNSFIYCCSCNNSYTVGFRHWSIQWITIRCEFVSDLTTLLFWPKIVFPIIFYCAFGWKQTTIVTCSRSIHRNVIEWEKKTVLISFPAIQCKSYYAIESTCGTSQPLSIGQPVWIFVVGRCHGLNWTFQFQYSAAKAITSPTVVGKNYKIKCQNLPIPRFLSMKEIKEVGGVKRFFFGF